MIMATGNPQSGTTTTRILIVDDHRTFGELLSLALTTQPDLECVGIARNAIEGERMILEMQPDIAVIDVEMPGMDGLELTRNLTAKLPELRVVVATAHNDPLFVAKAADAGACAFVPKDGALDDMLNAVRNARRGSMNVPADLLLALHQRPAAPAPRADDGGLTPRERDVLEMLADGLSVQQISRRLGISVHTCRGYVKTLLAKLDAHSQLEAVINATRRGILDVK